MDLDSVSPLFLSADYPSTGLLSGLALLILAKGLFRKKSAAWLLGLILFLYSAVSRLVYQKAFLQASISLFLALWLFLSLPRFKVRSGWPTSRQGVRVILGAVGFALIVAWLAENQGGDASLGFIGSLTFSFYVFGAIIGGYLLIKMLQPAKPPHLRLLSEIKRARSIVERYGQSSYAYLTLLDDKFYYFSPGGSLVAYAVIGRVALTLGDPVGPPEDISKAISGFRGFCACNDWIPAFCFTLPEYLKQYRSAGFDAICMGHEGIVKLNEFGLSGRRRSNFRKRYYRMHKRGFRVVHYEPPVTQEVVSELRQISDEWLQMTNRKEKRFFLGCFDEAYIRNGLVASVMSPDGKISAFVNLVPEYQRNEISIDLMRRRADAPSGTMDFLFVSLFLWARDHGFDTFNMGLCALSGIGEKLSDPPFERLLHWVYEKGNWIYDFKGLYEFKDKFQPDWVPQYLVYPELHSLPAVWIAMARVNAAE
jgi:phosphatidylglycerol lysyltransferase